MPMSACMPFTLARKPAMWSPNSRDIQVYSIGCSDPPLRLWREKISSIRVPRRVCARD